MIDRRGQTWSNDWETFVVLETVPSEFGLYHRVLLIDDRTSIAQAGKVVTCDEFAANPWENAWSTWRRMG